jgi:catechol 2,3-dioxygenase-like lactoylglutathione lyase family enzyme
VTALFAGLLVSDLPAAEAWWTAVLGVDPVMRPNDAEVVWEVGPQRYVYVDAALGGRTPGQGEVTLFLDDGLDGLDDRVAAISGHGIEPTLRETYDNGVRKVTFTDPDGNRLGLGSAEP